jgi:hypothetical protein
MTAFLDLLHRIRGDYISKIDQLLAPTLQDYLEGTVMVRAGHCHSGC